MVARFCSQTLEANAELVYFHGSFMLLFCVLNLVFSVVATLGNLLVIRALWKASSIPDNLKKLFLSLAFSDLAVGLFGHPMFAVVIAVMLKMAANGNNNFDFLCPAICTVVYFSLFMLACASFFTVTAIAVDRLLALSLHLRYQELITSKRVIISLVCLWLASSVAASVFIILPNHNNTAVSVTGFLGLFVTTAAYIYIYKVVRYHRRQIRNQRQLPNARAMELKVLRERKSICNAFLVYVIFLAFHLPNFCTVILLFTDKLNTSFLVANRATVFLVLLNSSLNPALYCWRYRELREIAKNVIKKLLSRGTIPET